MKRLKNKKGFTLVELLVAISILGLIMILAIPQLSNIQASNKKTKYVKYAESMLTSAKLYTDSYTEDMFGNNKSGCVDIPYSELKEKDLLKDIKIDSTSCKSDKSFVQVLKSNDHYIYGVSVSCKDKNDKIVYEKVLPKCGDNGPDTTGPTITITSNLNTETWDYGINKTATISVTDSYGMLENSKFRYYWTKNGEVVGEKKTHSYQNKRYEGSSTEGNKLSYTIDIPQNQTGKYILHVEPVDIRDANGNYQTHAVTKGEFYLDNTAPTVPDVSTYKWVNNEETSAPTSTTGLTGYTADTWSNKNVYSVATNSTDGDVDNNAGEVYYQYTTTGTTTNESNANGSKRNIKAEGESTIKYRACDAIDNCSEYTDPITLKIDKTPPTLSNPTNSSNSNWTNQNVVISATASDSGGSGLVGTYYNYDNTTTTKGNDWDTGSTASSVTGTWGAENNLNVYIFAEDLAGNTTKKSAGSVKIDKTPPTLSNPTNSSNSNWTNQNVVISATASDSGGSGLAGTYYNYDNTTTTKGNDWDTGSTASSVKGTWGAENNLNVYIFAEDLAGNTTKKSAGSVKIDKTPPTLSNITNSSNSNWTNQNVVISATASDSGGSGLAGTYYNYDNTTTTKGNDWDTGSTASSVKGTWGAENNLNVYIFAVDKVGNTTKKSAGSVKIDKTPPTMTKTSTTTRDKTNDDSTTKISYFNFSDTGGSGLAKFCRAHCAVKEDGNAPNYCASGYSAQERVEYFYNNNTSLDSRPGSKNYDNKSICHTVSGNTYNNFPMNTTFTKTTVINYAFKIVDAAGNVSNTYTYSG